MANRRAKYDFLGAKLKGMIILTLKLESNSLVPSHSFLQTKKREKHDLCGQLLFQNGRFLWNYFLFEQFQKSESQTIQTCVYTQSSTQWFQNL